jgi:ribosomal protein S18 acetylase RimI-like enzyme
MTDPPIALRLAAPRDVPRLVSLHFAVFDHSTHLATMLGRRFIKRCYDWYVGAGKGFVVVAEDSTGIVGLCAFNEGTYYRVFRANVVTAMWALALRPLVLTRAPVWGRISALLHRVIAPRVQKQGASGTRACLALLAVHPSARGRKIAQDVVNEGITQCAANGWVAVDTSVHLGNSAIALYERMGFVRDSTRDSDDLLMLQLDLSLPRYGGAEALREHVPGALARTSR